MGRIAVSTVIEATPAKVWEAVQDIGSHVEWMADATAIRITSAQQRGVGTTFDCDTKIGPARLTDRMEITEWEPGRAMGVVHVGLVTGTGRFTLTSVPGSATEFQWAEDLVFPWWMGAQVGGVLGGAVMKLVWKRNLAALKERIENDL